MYEALLERDPHAIRRAIAEFRATHSIDQLFGEVARFAVLAYAPSEHGKHAVLSVLSAYDVGLTGELLTECAIYAANARQPWSEPPIATPPKPASDGSIDELRAAIADGDRLRGEAWLARRLDDARADYFLAATDDFEDLGHKLIVAVAASRLASMFPPFPTLRIGIWEMTAYRSDRYEERGVALDTETLLARLIDTAVANRGDIVSMHAIFLLDAALQTEDDVVIRRVRDYLTTIVEDRRSRLSGQAGLPVLQPYALARDYGALLKAHAVVKRLPQVAPVIAAAQYNLEHSSSFEEFSFA